MSISLQPVDLASNYIKHLRSSNNNKIKHLLKSKENIIEYKYRKELKRKLKKYKLRRDGQEDQEVLDVSNILVTSLKIKSPNNKEESGSVDCTLHDELRPKNYLFKMGKRKQILMKSESGSFVANDDKTRVVNSVSSLNQHVVKIENIKSCRKSETDTIHNSDDDLLLYKESDKKQTNAFKLLMESRNKSIGTNSPGKEKVLEEFKDPDEMRNLKVKRTLLLQKMAEAKGSIKNKEVDKYQEKVIKNKMKKRAERLKSLILQYDSKPSAKIKKIHTVEAESIKIQTKIEVDPVLNSHRLHLVDLFQDSTTAIEKTVTKYVTEDESKFLKKLSPSLKKQENMMCYFKKIEKGNSLLNDDDKNDNVLFKIKLNSKSKKKIKKMKLSLNKETDDDLKIEPDDPVNINNVCTEILSSGNSISIVDETNAHENNENIDVIRPRRNIKRPAKYIDEVFLSSSDEELHIFTPKKKKRTESKTDSEKKVNNDTKAKCLKTKKQCRELNTVDSKFDFKNKFNDKSKPNMSVKLKKQSREMIKSKLKIKQDQIKKPIKLAPIFNTKSQLDAASLEAKQKFLNSGVPDKLKKITEKHNDTKVWWNTFHTVVHIQQNEPSSFLKSSKIDYGLSSFDDDFVYIMESKDLYKNLLCYDNLPNTKGKFNQLSTENEIQKLLHGIKKNYPEFPVYRTYRLLKDKNRGEYKDSSVLDFDNSVEIMGNVIDVNIDSPDQLNWSDKYKPMSSKEIIGNFETTKEVKKWLISWTENDVKRKNLNNIDSDSSDFYYSDTDSKDSVKLTNNLLILNGPVGSGKTSIVYAVAAELAIKVLEVNASSKRTGKIMLQDLQEATQSHKVNRGKSSQEYSQKSQEGAQVEILIKSKKKCGKSKKSSKKKENDPNNEISSRPQMNQDSSRTCMSLILIDDADVVFEQDDGFCSAIVQLVQCSKRPVVLITTSTTCLHLQKFIQTAKIINTHPLQPRMLGTWLDIMCLVENNSLTPGIGSYLLNYFRGDIRKTINYLQFYFPKNTLPNEIAQGICNDLKLNVEDENSNVSWSDKDVIEEKQYFVSENYRTIECLTQFFYCDEKRMFFSEFPIQLFNVWWNVPRLLNVNNFQVNQKTQKQFKQSKKSLEMQALSSALDAISVSDCFRRGHFGNNITDSPWLNIEQDSVSEQETLVEYNKCDVVVDEITHAIVTSSIRNSQKTLAIDHDNNVEYPGLMVQRDIDKTISRHNNLTKFLNSSAALDRRALALDYWSCCRTICRIEKSKTDINLKRNNRYCHYLKSLNILSNNDYFDSLSKGLSLRKD